MKITAVRAIPVEKDPFRIAGGFAWPLEGPGLGVTIDPAALDRRRIGP